MDAFEEARFFKILEIWLFFKGYDRPHENLQRSRAYRFLSFSPAKKNNIICGHFLCQVAPDYYFASLLIN